MLNKRIKGTHIAYRIINRKTETAVGSYSRAYHEEFDFESVKKARTANCRGIFENKKKYKINKYKVTYELIEEDCE